jgi:hypothetical protein
MEKELELLHRFEMVQDDIRVLIAHLKDGKKLSDKTKYADDGHTHVNNIHIALDTEDNECLSWDRFTNPNMNVNNIIEMIKEEDVDGETMQYILEKVGMDYQMYKQLNVEYNDENFANTDWLFSPIGEKQ